MVSGCNYHVVRGRSICLRNLRMGRSRRLYNIYFHDSTSDPPGTTEADIIFLCHSDIQRR